MRFIAALFLTLVLAACAGGTPTTPAQSVYAIHGNYAAALTIAVAYKKLPSCDTAATLLCAKSSIVKQLQDADDIAYPALQAAEATVRSPGAGANLQTVVVGAQAAVDALTAITAKLQTK